jgi:hypothetical protein
MEKIVIAYTKWTQKGKMDNPIRYVVLEHVHDGKIMEYSRHMEIDDGVHKENYAHGDYCGTAREALNSLMNTVIKNNRIFLEGNVSHIPGVVEELADIDELPLGSKYDW